MKILSIDFDYFLDTDLNTREQKFPDGVEGKSRELVQEEWNFMYSKYPEIADIGVLENEFSYCCEKLSKLVGSTVLIADSHKEIEKIFSDIHYMIEHISLKHIDFHHDNYISGGNKLDCANWLRHIMSEITDMEVEWIRREDSEVTSLTGDFPYPNTTDLVLDDHYDYVFICFSPEWTPPHLRKEYEKMCNCVEHLEYLE